MKKYWIAAATLITVLVVAAGAFLLGRQYARPSQQGPLTSTTFQDQTIIELRAAVALAMQHVAGEVLKVELEREDGRFVYEVKVLAQNGRVQEVELDAQDGSLIEIEND